MSSRSTKKVRFTLASDSAHVQISSSRLANDKGFKINKIQQICSELNNLESALTSTFTNFRKAPPREGPSLHEHREQRPILNSVDLGQRSIKKQPRFFDRDAGTDAPFVKSFHSVGQRTSQVCPSFADNRRQHRERSQYSSETD